MAQEKGGGLVLSSLADRQLLPSSSEMLATDYAIYNLDYPSTWSLKDFEFLGQRGLEMEWLEKHLPDIKDRLLKVVRGQVSWEKLKLELIAEGYKGASEIKKSTIDALIEEQRTRAKGLQQDHRLGANIRKFGEETIEVNTFTDSLIELDLASLRAKNAASLKQRQQAADAGDAEEIAAWEADRKVNNLEAAAMLLQYGSAARSHPKFPGSSRASLGEGFASGGSARPVSFGGFNGNRQQSQYRDQLKVEINGNVAGAMNRVASRVGTGVQKIRNFFFGG